MLSRLVDSKLISGVVLVGGMTIGVKVVAFLKELSLAHFFGTSDEADAFLIAFFVTMITAYIVGDAFRDAVIPIWAEKRAQLEKGKSRLITNTLWICVAVLLFVSMLTLIFDESFFELVAGNFSPEKQERCSQLLRLLFPCGIFWGLASVLKGYLQANDRFALTSAAPAIVPAFIIAALFLIPGPPSTATVSIAASAGALVMLIVFWISAERLPGRRLMRLPKFNADTRTVLHSTFPLLAGTVVNECYIFIDTMMATALPSGSVAVLSYAQRTCTIVLAVAGSAAAQVLFPHIADLAGARDWDKLRRVVKRFTWLMILCTLPFVFFFWVAAEPVVRILFQRGEFTPEDTTRVAEVLRFAAFQIPGYILAALGCRLAIALRANHFLLITNIIGLGANVGLNLLFIDWYGVKGIALSTAVINFAAGVVYYTYCGIRVRRFAREKPARAE